MTQLIFDFSNKAGLAPNFYGDITRSSAEPNLRFNGTEGQLADGICNPKMKDGYLYPANNSFKDLTFSTTVNQKFGSSIYDSANDDLYLAERGQQIYQADGGSDTSFTQKINLGGAEKITDMEIYQVNGVRKLFYAYRKSAGGNIGITDLPVTSWDDDYFSTVPASGTNTGATNEVIMQVADNGYMYILDGNKVHKLDGTTDGGAGGTVTQEVLVFPSFYQLLDVVDFRGKMYFAIEQSDNDYFGAIDRVIASVTQSGVYLWDRSSTSVSMTDYISIEGVRSIRKLYIGPDGDLRIICLSSDLTTQIRRFDGYRFKIIQELGPIAYPAYRDSLVNIGSSIMWLGMDGIVYRHGKLNNLQTESLYKVGDINSWGTLQTASGSPTGVILASGNVQSGFGTGYNTIQETIIMTAYDSSSNILAKKWFPNGTGAVDSVDQIGHIGNVYSLVKLVPINSTVTDLTMYMAPTTNSGSTTIGTLKIYFNQSTTAWASKTITLNDSNRGYINIPINKQFIHAMQVEIEYDVAETLGMDTLAPSMAIANYQPTSAKG